jgi:hypothetical protein
MTEFDIPKLFQKFSFPWNVQVKMLELKSYKETTDDPNQAGFILDSKIQNFETKCC